MTKDGIINTGDFRQILRDKYLDYINNYISVEKFGEHNGLDYWEAHKLINLCKEVYEAPHPEA